MKDYQVYMIYCKDTSLYTGISKDPDERFKKHLSGQGAKYFYHTKPELIMYRSPKMSKSDALKLEIRLKKFSHNEKLCFIDPIVGEQFRRKYGIPN